MQEEPLPGSAVDAIDLWSLSYVDRDACEQLACPICQTALVEPYMTQCGHSFCRNCIQAVRVAAESAGTRFRCPVDREILTAEVVPAPLVVASLADDLVVRCPLDCGLTTKRWLIESHVLEECENAHVLCLCSKTIQRRDWTGTCSHADENAKAIATAQKERDSAKVDLKDDLKDELKELETGMKPSLASGDVPTNDAVEAVRYECPGRVCGCVYEATSEDDAKSHRLACPLALIAPVIRTHQQEIHDLRLENKTLRRELTAAMREGRREAATLDSHMVSEYDRLWHQVAEVSAAREGQAKSLMALSRDNARITEDITFLRSNLDSLHRQLTLSMLSQRRMSMYSSTPFGLARSDSVLDNADRSSNGPEGASELRAIQKL